MGMVMPEGTTVPAEKNRTVRRRFSVSGAVIVGVVFAGEAVVFLGGVRGNVPR